MKNFLIPMMFFGVLFMPLSIISQESDGIEEVIVTATKKEESTQDLALSIEAYTTEMLDNEQIYDASDLADVVPGFETAKGIANGSAYTLRGIGSYGIGAAVVSSLVTNINGHSVGTSQFAGLGFVRFDREIDVHIRCLIDGQLFTL